MWDYWLVDGNVVPVPEGTPRQPLDVIRVGFKQWGGGEGPTVVTTFLGYNHTFDDDNPEFFETLIQWEGNDIDGAIYRCATLEAAKIMHTTVVAGLQIIIDHFLAQPMLPL